MSEPVKVIAKITHTRLGYEDHGLFDLSLCVDYGGSGQWIGGYCLDTPVWRDVDGSAMHQRPPGAEGDMKRWGTSYGMEFIARTLRACGVTSWEKIAGRTIIVLKEHDGWNAPVVGIENLPTEKGERFVFADLKREIDELHFALGGPL
jgi:hypothetical protein